jgi:hypothetical protein
MKLQRGFDGRLGMEFRREGDLEENVFHHVLAEFPCERHRLAAEERILKSPSLRRQRRRIPHLTAKRS